MSSEKSRTSGGGTRITTTVESRGILGEDSSYVRTKDYDANGRKTGETLTDCNGNVWNVDSTGRTTHIITNDGRNDD